MRENMPALMLIPVEGPRTDRALVRPLNCALISGCQGCGGSSEAREGVLLLPVPAGVTHGVAGKVA